MLQIAPALAPLLAATIVATAALVGLSLRTGNAPIVVGKVDAAEISAIEELGPEEVPVPELRPDPLLSAKGSPPGPALEFRGAVNVPDDLLFFLVVGSDARPGQDVTRTRADSIHIAAVDPVSREGALIGLPRDSYVPVPGRGRQKINAALVLGGPKLLVATVRQLTGLPVSHYAVTGFEGITKIVDALKGLDVKVPYRMDDHYSGARFEKGWHRMDGRQVLAFTRARYGIPGGDFGRSENQGRVIKHALAKMRSTTDDASDLKKWLEVLYKHAKLDMSLREALELAKVARQLDPGRMDNVVASGRAQTVNGQSVVVLDEDAYALFRDVGADAVADGDKRRPGQASGGKGSSEPAPGGSEPDPKPTKKPSGPPQPDPTPVIELPV